MSIKVRVFSVGDPVELHVAGVMVELDQDETEGLIQTLQAAHDMSFSDDSVDLDYEFTEEVEING